MNIKTYEGETINGIPHGKGKKTYDNGDVYEGDWFNGLQHGKGKYTTADGDVYNGVWINDILRIKMTVINVSTDVST